MNKVIFSLITLILFTSCQTRKKNPNIITTDITNFWEAYDKIISTQDSVLQYKYLDSLYFKKGTVGLEAIKQVRDYTAQDYISAINNYPKFWTSIRENTMKANQLSQSLESGIEKLREIYPDLKPAKIYFTIGALRTNGTTLDSLVLIGSELAMTDKNTVSSEFPKKDQEGRQTFFSSNPIEDVVLLNIHEYVHTQQKPMFHNLLSSVIYEGVAEFVSVKAMGVPSTTPAIAYGKKNAQKVIQKFEDEMFYPNNIYKWLWSDARNNSFGVRDLGYYIGYQMSENFYEQSKDKKEAIKKLIELDFNDQFEIERFAYSTGLFSAPIDELHLNFDKRRPNVIGIKPFENNSQNVSSKIKHITIEFSEPLNGYNTGIDFGELGKEAFPKINTEEVFWAKDNRSWTIAVDLEPDKAYQILVSNNFRTKAGIPLKSYLINFKTGNE